MTSTNPVEPRAVGRPRDGRVDAAIRDATVELLVEGGYRELSMEAIARRAGTTKRTVYRRWPSKARLVHEIVFPDDDDHVLPPPTGDLATDLRAIVAGTFRNFGRPEVRAAAPGLMTEFHHDPELHRLLVSRLDRRARTSFRELIRAGIARGDVREGADSDVVFGMIVGTSLFNAVLNEPADHVALVDAVTDLLVHAVRR